MPASFPPFLSSKHSLAWKKFKAENPSYVFTNLVGSNLGRNDTFCLDCLPGQHTELTGQDMCSKCSKGQYTEEPGGIRCLNCAVGTHIDQEGATLCLDCLPGMYNAQEAQSVCTNCPRSKYQAKSRQTECDLPSSSEVVQRHSCHALTPRASPSSARQ